MMTTKRVYPSIIYKGENDYIVYFPDVDGCLVQGETYLDAIIKAEEALGIYLAFCEEEGLPVPYPSNALEITCEANERIVSICTDVKKYYKERSVKKTLTIPKWLNDNAEAKHINFSATLQRALKEELQKFAS
jgi:predicted RNase H-like HicB family nuclease